MISYIIMCSFIVTQAHATTPAHLGEHGHFKQIKEYVTRYQFSPPPSDLRTYNIWIPDLDDPIYVPPDTYTPKKITLSPYGLWNDVLVLTRKAIDKEITIDNKPTAGYIFEDTTHLISPKGFRVSLDEFTLNDILLHDKINNKVIDGKFIWVAFGTETLLVRYDSEFYKAVRKKAGGAQW